MNFDERNIDIKIKIPYSVELIDLINNYS